MAEAVEATWQTRLAAAAAVAALVDLAFAAPDFYARRCATQEPTRQSDWSAHSGSDTEYKGEACGRPVSPYCQLKLIPRASRADLVDQCGGVSQDPAVCVRYDIALAQPM
jgi:hypothetical protein